MFGLVLLVNGHETIGNMITLGTVALLAHPDQLVLLREAEDPAAFVGAVGELLRYLSVTQSGRRRVAPGDIVVAGQLTRAGEGVVLPGNQATATRRPSPTRAVWTCSVTPAGTLPSASDPTTVSVSR